MAAFPDFIGGRVTVEVGDITLVFFAADDAEAFLRHHVFG